MVVEQQMDRVQMYTSIAGPFCELGPSVNTLFSQIHHVPRLPILSGSQLGSSMYYCVTVFKYNLNGNVIFKKLQYGGESGSWFSSIKLFSATLWRS